MTRAFFLIVIPTLVTSVLGCKPDEPISPKFWTRYDYLNEAIEYIYFEPGSFWVYKKSPGGELDTIELISSIHDTIILRANEATIFYERIEWVAQSRLDNFAYKFKVRTQPNPMTTSENATSYRQYFLSKSKPGNVLGSTNVYTYPYTMSILNNGAPHNTQKLIDIDTIEIEGVTYYNPIRFEISDDQTFNWGLPGQEGGIVKYTWAPNVGIIQKKHMTKDITWNLIDSKIIQ